jgi:hypothetical protein
MATPEQWADTEHWAQQHGHAQACILELRARVEQLEAAAHKHIVETSANILALASRLEALEVAKRPASRVHEISKPLRLTPDQVQQALDQLRPKSKPSPNSSQIGRSLVERVARAIGQDDEPINWEPEAHAAIREVVAWLKEGEHTWTALKLDKELER